MGAGADGVRDTTPHLLMVRPACFGPNAATAASNAFQQQPAADAGATALAARREFDSLVAALRDARAQPFVVEDSTDPPKPDAVFPNNWVSFHADGTVVLYPMEALNRRPERRLEILQQLAEAGLIRLDRLLDLSHLERCGLFLEGTGSLVMDRRAGQAYAALSSRTHAAALTEFSRATGIEVLAFHTADAQGRPLYHTNVMLSIGRSFALVCAEAISYGQERAKVLRSLAAAGREVLEISRAQANAFVGNMLEVGTTGARTVIAMSAQARAALGPALEGRLQAHADILAVPVPVIERVGGGSVRCMLAEVFVPGDE